MWQRESFLVECPAVLVAAGRLGSAVLVQDNSMEAFCEPSMWLGGFQAKGMYIKNLQVEGRGAELHCRHRAGWFLLSLSFVQHTLCLLGIAGVENSPLLVLLIYFLT